MRVIFDIETDGLLDDARRVWCISCLDIKTERIYSFTPENIKEGLTFLQDCEELIGHNIIEFDLPILKRLYGFVPNVTTVVTDTLVQSRTLFPNLQELDLNRRNTNNIRIGSHSLEAWGVRLNFHKGSYGQQSGAWDKFTPEMLEYCELDVRLNFKLYEMLQDHIVKYGNWQDALELETRIHTLLCKQTERGFPFDVDKAQALYADLADQKNEIEQKLVSTVEPNVIEMKTKTKVIPFNPASRQQAADRLIKMGWQPEVFTPSGEPKVDEAVLKDLEFDLAKDLMKFLMLNKRIGQLATGKQGWLSLHKDGVIHGRVNHMGAVTSRCTHNNPNVAQVPSCSAPYGKECRELFHAPEGYTLLGADASGLELRCLASYMKPFDNGSYAHIVLNGDVHTKNQEAAGLETRPQAKTFIYAFLYGAGEEKIGSIIGGGKSEGRKVKNRFLKQTPALKVLREKVASAAEKGWIKGLDGRRIPIRHPHAALNTLLQSAGAIICKKWYVEIHDLLEQAGLTEDDARVVAFVHDEVQIIVKQGLEETVGEITQRAIRNVQHDIGFGCRLDADYQTGANWASTH